MSEPQIIIGGAEGIHNRDERRSRKRIKDGKAYRNLSTVCVVPTRGTIPARVVENWMGLMVPMNQAFVRMFVSGMEVGAAYNAAVETITEHPVLRDFKYLLTMEEDNMPPADGLLKLYESMDDYAVVAGLYWTKGEGGQPMIYGDPKGILAFQPQVPKPDAVQPCNGTGMGFTLFDMRLFSDERIPRPWFKTIQEVTPGGGIAMGTQDLYFMGNVRRAGYKIASDNRVKVGHLDSETGMVW
jgi:hypothetical protein